MYYNELVAQIHYSKDTELTWHRVKRGQGFGFVTESGKTISKKGSDRITKLAIPPGWSEVSVSKNPMNYIQAIGVDAAGRKQYIYQDRKSVVEGKNVDLGGRRII